MRSVLGQGEGEYQVTSTKVLRKTVFVGLIWMLLDNQLEKVASPLLRELETQDSA